jgi:hypothetical protein
LPAALYCNRLSVVNMNTKVYCCLFVVVFCVVSFNTAIAKKIHNKQKKYSLLIPDAMISIVDTAAGDEGDMYYDKAAGIILMISDRRSKFKSVKEYMDCSNKQLEDQLKNFYSDTTLKLISCNRSQYYPEETTVLHFSVGVLSYGFTTCMVYFIHHRGNDLQFSFTYSKDVGKQSMQYIDDIMRTLELK